LHEVQQGSRMKNLVEIVNSVEAKARQLLQQRNDYAQKNAELKTLLKTQQAEITKLQQVVDNLKNDNQHLKTANAVLGSEDYKQETKRKINSLIREIDHCIVQLSA